MKLSEHKKWIAVLLVVGVGIPLIAWWAISSTQSPGEENPFAQMYADLPIRGPLDILGNDALDALCASPGRDGLSWDTAYVLENFKIDMKHESAGQAGIAICSTNRCLIIQNVCVEYTSASGMGIHLYFCENLNVTGCGLFQNHDGIVVSDCNNISILNNKFWENSDNDIRLSYLYSSKISGNEMRGSGRWNGLSVSMYYWGNITIDPSNTVNGKPIYYYEGQQNMHLTGVPAAAVILFNCTNSSLSQFSFSDSDIGFQIANSTNTSIFANRITDGLQESFLLQNSPYSSIFDNFLQNTTMVQVIYSNNTLITNNTIDHTRYGGLYLYNSSSCNITGNSIHTTDYWGLQLYQSHGCNITNNSIVNCKYSAIGLSQSGSATITGNYFCSNNLHNTTGNSDIDLRTTTGGNTISGNIEEARCTWDTPDGPDATPDISGCQFYMIIGVAFFGIIGSFKKRSINNSQKAFRGHAK